MENVVEIKDKFSLTFEEASELTGIGVNKIRTLAKIPKCPFTLNIGNKHKLIIREEFQHYLLEHRNL